MRKLFSYFISTLLAVLSFQASAQLSSCPGNTVLNSNLSSGTPSTSDEDINNASNFSSIWNNSGSTLSGADFYVGTYSPLGSPPQPATGNYASCWIANHTTDIGFREGFMHELSSTISAGSGSYNYTFDMACLGAGWGSSAKLAVYGVYNPSNGFAPNAPTSPSSPNNLGLFGTSNTVLIGTTTIYSCSNNKVTKSFTINSGLLSFPSQGITHLFITRADQASGGRYMAFDNFCIQPIAPCPVVTSEQLVCTGFDHNFDGVLDYEYTFSVTPNSGSTSISLTCGSLNQSFISFSGGAGPGTYTVTFYPSSSSCSFSAYHSLSSTNSSNCFGHQSNVPYRACPGGGGGLGRLNVTPNPATTQVQVTWDDPAMPDQIAIGVFNSNGVRVQSLEGINRHNGNQLLNVVDLPQGVYYISITGEGYAPAPTKFIKK